MCIKIITLTEQLVFTQKDDEFRLGYEKKHILKGPDHRSGWVNRLKLCRTFWKKIARKLRVDFLYHNLTLVVSRSSNRRFGRKWSNFSSLGCEVRVVDHDHWRLSKPIKRVSGTP